MVFARLGLQLWVRRDGLSWSFRRSDDFPNNMRLHWARGVFVEALEKDDNVLSCYRANEEVMQTLLAQGEEKGEAGRRAGWAAFLTGKKLARGTKGQLFERQQCRTALGWQS